MTQLDNIEHIAFWETKCNIILAQYYMKDFPLAKRKTINRYNMDIKFISTEPRGKDAVTEFLLNEGFLEKTEHGNIKITNEGKYTLEQGILVSNTHKLWKNEIMQTLALGSMLIAMGSLFIAALNS